MNGTTNYILTQANDGIAYDKALKKANTEFSNSVNKSNPKNGLTNLLARRIISYEPAFSFIFSALAININSYLSSS